MAQDVFDFGITETVCQFNNKIRGLLKRYIKEFKDKVHSKAILTQEQIYQDHLHIKGFGKYHFPAFLKGVLKGRSLHLGYYFTGNDPVHFTFPYFYIGRMKLALSSMCIQISVHINNYLFHTFGALVHRQQIVQILEKRTLGLHVNTE